MVRDVLAGAERREIVQPVRAVSAAGWGLLGAESKLTVSTWRSALMPAILRYFGPFALAWQQADPA